MHTVDFIYIAIAAQDVSIYNIKIVPGLRDPRLSEDYTVMHGINKGTIIAFTKCT